MRPQQPANNGNWDRGAQCSVSPSIPGVARGSRFAWSPFYLMRKLCHLGRRQYVVDAVRSCPPASAAHAPKPTIKRKRWYTIENVDPLRAVVTIIHGESYALRTSIVHLCALNAWQTMRSRSPSTSITLCRSRSHLSAGSTRRICNPYVVDTITRRPPRRPAPSEANPPWGGNFWRRGVDRLGSIARKNQKLEHFQ